MSESYKEKLALLRERVKEEVSEKRFKHILSVEECALKMSGLFADILSEEDFFLISASALLHDVTKDKGDTWQREYITAKNIEIPKGDEESIPLFHSFTAPEYIKENYPDFAQNTVLSAVYKHATADKDMSLADKIICLADYIEPTRKYPSCIEVRKKFFGENIASSSLEERLKHLDECLFLSLRYVKKHLEASGEKISNKTANLPLGEGGPRSGG